MTPWMKTGRWRQAVFLGALLGVLSAGTAAAQTDRARLILTEVAQDNPPALLVSVVNVGVQPVLVSDRFLLKGGVVGVGELWLEVRDDQSAEVVYRCSGRAAPLLARHLRPLQPRDSVGRLVPLDDCYRLQAGRSYR